MFVRWVEEKNEVVKKSLLDVLEENVWDVFRSRRLRRDCCPIAIFPGYLRGQGFKGMGFLKAKEITEEKIKIVQRLNKIALQRNQTLTQMALSWLLKDKRVTSVLIGVSSLEQLENNLGCLNNLDYAKEELAQIENILKG
jgi:L-glyceraldehyde 3-phosphate reductase